MTSDSLTTAQTTTQNRLRVFAGAFKGYMGVMPLVTAALAPLLTFLRAFPTYESQRTTLATLSGVLGFLTLAWLFYVRRTIALGSLVRGFRFLINMIPFLLIVGTVASFIAYFQILGVSTGSALELAEKNQWKYVEKDRPLEFKTESDVLRHWDDRPIPHSISLELLYLAVFLSAECAFVLMALREYINDTRRVSELEWMFGKQDAEALKDMQKRIQERLQSEAASNLGAPPEKKAT
jgi:hypothetical protein